LQTAGHIAAASRTACYRLDALLAAEAIILKDKNEQKLKLWRENHQHVQSYKR